MIPILSIKILRLAMSTNFTQNRRAQCMWVSIRSVGVTCKLSTFSSLTHHMTLHQEKLLDLFGDVFELHDTVFVMDATAPGSAATRALKQYLADCKAKVTQVSLG